MIKQIIGEIIDYLLRDKAEVLTELIIVVVLVYIVLHF